MKSHAISLFVLTLSSSGISDRSILPNDRPASLGAIGFSADRLTDFVRNGINVFDHLSSEQQLDIRSCTLRKDVAPGIQAAVTASVRAGRAGRIVLPDGCYRIRSSIRLPSNIELVGASMRETKLMPDGDFPAIMAVGSYANGLTGVGIQNMSIQCAGMHNLRANGIHLVYVNRGNLKDLYFNGCHHALDLYDQWQTKIDNIQVDGLGRQQNSVGVYMGNPTDPENIAPNNAVILSNSTVQNVDQYGYQLQFFAGSKFVNDEAMNGRTGWKLCGSGYVIANQACQFGHFMNILADTTGGPGIIVDQGANSKPVNNVMFDHVWIGSSREYAMILAGVVFSQFDNIHITSADTGVYIKNSNNVKISTNIENQDRINNGRYAVMIEGGQDNIIWANNTKSNHSIGYNGIVETESAFGNALWGGLADCTLSLEFGNRVSAGSVQPSYKMRACRYEVQGRHVRVTFQFALAATGAGGGPVRIAGLPFAADMQAPANTVAGTIVGSAMRGLNGNIIARIDPGQISVGLVMQGSDNAVPVTHQQFTASSTLSGVLDYIKK